MKPADFRIGNIITDENGFEMYVVGIGEDWLTADFEGNQGDVWEFDFKTSFPKPIKLTEKVSEEMLGFKRNDVGDLILEIDCSKFLGFFAFNKSLSYLSNGDGKVNLFTNPDETYLLSVDYLHEIQNIYWCLCGKEIYKLTNEELKLK